MVVVTGRSGNHMAHYRKMAIQRSQAEAGKGLKGGGYATQDWLHCSVMLQEDTTPNLSGLGVYFLLLTLHN